MKPIKALVAGLALSAGVLASAIAPASAGTASTTFQVTLNVTAACTVSASSTGLHFANYDSNLAQTSNADLLDVNCTQGAPYTISLNEGLQASTDGFAQMVGGTNNGVAAAADLKYQIFQDAANSIAWNGPGKTGLASVGTGASQQFAGYAAIPAGQPYFVGSYVDTVTANVNF